MTDKVRITIAAIVTALCLATVSVAGVIAHGSNLATATPTVNRAVPSGQSRRPSQPNPAPASLDHAND
jgi:hypothetical protein